ncbi:MAG TPA: radical SAM protein, partial [Vicinamibacteria bacterium]|nr:radical SAM protein [Vicinamibacteria bacterium]
GLVVRGPDGPVVGPDRSLPRLDDLAWPDRRGRPHDVLGIPTAPIVGSRGCYADCSFCCIFAYAENAKGPRYRRRSVADIVAEMKRERERRGIRLFVFHDDNFFLPHLPANVKRYSEMRDLLRAEGLDDVALVVKCRPNDVDRGLFELLKDMGVIRAYVGIETNSDEGIVSLNRRITSQDNRRALRLLEELDVYCSFNVLIFDPEATLQGIEANLDFMEEMADRPFNFCRAEVYAGTPLKHVLESQGRLEGDYFAWGYRMRAPRVELLFRIASTAFASRNFKPDGVHNLNMGIRFDNEVMRFFYPQAWDPEWQARLRELSEDVARHGVSRMRSALAFARSVETEDHGAVKAFTLELARDVARADLSFIGRVKALRREMEARILACGGRLGRPDPRVAAPPWAAESARLGSSIGLELSTELLPAPVTAGEEAR